MTSPVPAGPVVAVVVCRDGRLPAGAEEVVAEAGGVVVVAGTGAETAAARIPGAGQTWWWEADAGLGGLAAALSGAVAGGRCVVLPASPDGRDLAPHLAAIMGRPLLAGATQVRSGDDGVIRAELLRVDGQVVVPAEVAGPAVATLVPGARGPGSAPPEAPAMTHRLQLNPSAGLAPTAGTGAAPTTDPEVLALVAPDPATMDLADATRVLGGGAGLVPRTATDAQARSLFALLTDVAAALGASAGATRVVTDAGWAGHDRQIGTTGVAVDPDLYIAFGVSGASQHTGGLGTPRHIVSVNTDPSCPMTAVANLGIVTDATGVLVELAGRLGVAVPAELEDRRG
jgi:electron transfer flavoprotein alpha subunit